MADLSSLLAVMTAMRRLVALPDNDFAWSAWRDHQAALADLARAIADLTQGAVPPLSWLFAPTGPLQDVSLRSGWGAEFLALAARFDAAMTHHSSPGSPAARSQVPRPAARKHDGHGPSPSGVSAPRAAHARTAEGARSSRQMAYAWLGIRDRVLPRDRRGGRRPNGRRPVRRRAGHPAGPNALHAAATPVEGRLHARAPVTSGL